METQNNQSKRKNIRSLVAGLAFLGLGSYRVYNHYFNESISYDNLRLILSIVFIGYGAYRIYNYLSAE